MGSTETPIPTKDEPRELTVLVTGFGPFREEYPVNPSWEIASRLPAYLPPPPRKDPLQDVQRRGEAPPLPPVRIQRHPEPVRVNYQAVRELVPKLWDESSALAAAAGVPPGQKVDLMLHIGMAGSRPFYSIEERGHRDGYRMQDVDSQLLGDEERHDEQGDGWVWHGLPHEIETDLDLKDVLDRWLSYSPHDARLQISKDAGRYLCDFIYYSSLAHLHRLGRPKKVVFLHVPADCRGGGREDPYRQWEYAVNLTVALIRAALESEEERKRRAEDGEGEGAPGGRAEDGDEGKVGGELRR